MLIAVIGRPGSGKTTLCKNILSYVKGHYPEISISHIDEYSYVKKFIENDANKHQISGNEITERSVFSQIQANALKDAFDALKVMDCVLLEFSRATYINTIETLIENVLDVQIVYVQANLDECKQRNDDRNSAANSTIVPTDVIDKYYRKDDIKKVIAEKLCKTTLIKNKKGLDELKDIVETLIENSIAAQLLQPPLKVLNEYPKGQKRIVGLLVTYLALFSTAIIFHEKITSPIQNIRLFQLTLLSIACGGIGSTMYCIRSFYSYYADGYFNYRKYGWWYLFRPLMGSLVCLLLFWGLSSPKIALMNVESSANSKITVAALCILAGFSTEQVIERIRKTSKALFGDKDDKGKPEIRKGA